jgi:S-formylglutathione hydrolase FrmB
VFYLAGAGEDVGRLGSEIRAMWRAMQEDGNTELILVELDGQNSLSANFYANSPIGGNAEDALTADLVAYVDVTYRTLGQASARGLSGFSMGGSGTINIGLAHPDVFSALYASSPGLLAPDGGLEGFLRSNGAWRPYGATFAPDPSTESYMVPIDPVVPLAEQDPTVVAAWESGYGALTTKLDAYLAGEERLTEVHIAVGTTDVYPWIPEGCAYLLGLLEEAGVSASSDVFEGGHSLDPGFAVDYVAYFSRTLQG